MSARANLVITDRATTPVAHTYSPDGSDSNGVAIWSEKTTVPAGNPRFTASLKSSNGKYKPSLRLSIPIVQTQIINGVSTPVVVRTAYCEVNMTFDALAPDQERADCVGLMANAMQTAQTQINDMIVKLSPVY